MDSKITDTTRIIDTPRSIPIPFNMEGLNESGMCDLNKVFQVNFTYNIELLKNLLEGILKFQKSTEEELEAIKEESKERNIKMKKLESKLFGIGSLSLSNINKNIINDGKKDEKKQKIENNKENDDNININEEQGKIIIHNPQGDNIVLETSESNSDIINKIIVSIYLFIYIIIYFIYIEKNK